MAHVGLIRWLPFHGPKHEPPGTGDERQGSRSPVVGREELPPPTLETLKAAPCYACELSSGKRALVTVGLVLFMAVFAVSVYWTASLIDWRHQIGPFIPAWPLS